LLSPSGILLTFETRTLSTCAANFQVLQVHVFSDIDILLNRRYVRAILTDTRNRSEVVHERSLELDLDVLACYLLHRSRSAARSNYPVLRGSKDLPRSQLYVVRIPVDPVHDGTREMGHTDPRLTPHGQ